MLRGYLEKDSRLSKQQNRPRGFTLTELIAVIAILGVLAGLIVPRFSSSNEDSKRNACYVNQGNIEVRAMEWKRNTGSWPAGNLSDIGADLDYFPSTLPTCPVDGSSYSIDSTGHVIGHTH